jgi:peptidoglycan hydrolase-like protein with peptidoglycan-binding domain
MATSTDLRAAIDEVQRQLPAGQVEAGGIDGLYEAGPATSLEQRVGALPWWVISAVVHSVLFLLCTLIGVALPPPNMDEVSITTDIAKKEEPKYDEKKKRDIFKNPQEVKAEKQVENPVVVHEQAEISETFETDNNMDNQNARGSEDAISDIPLGGTGVTGSMGVGGGGMAGCFGYRDGGGRKKAVGRFGGSPATESAVEAALRWLKRHQEADGHWDCRKYGGTTLRNEGSVGVTGLATLAFLGAGYTHKTGKYKDNVRRAVKWLVKQQQDNGLLISGAREPGYPHAISGLALAEAYGMTKDAGLRGPAQKAVEYSISTHQASYSGWRYKARQGGDLSVTGWFVMQLKSARIAGLRVDGAGFQGAANFLNRVTSKGGGGMYQPGKGVAPAMTAVGMVSRQFMGTPNTDPLLVGGANYLLRALPEWKIGDRPQDRKLIPCSRNTLYRRDFYYFYYGTLCMFQQGGDSWKKWNAALKPVLLENQKKGGPMDGTVNDVDGSWDPWGNSGKRAGRVFQTAVGALCMEVYYRYLPMYTK